MVAETPSLLLVADEHWVEWWEEGFLVNRDLRTSKRFVTSYLSQTWTIDFKVDVLRFALGTEDLMRYLPLKRFYKQETKDLGELVCLALASLQAELKCKVEVCEPLPQFEEGVSIDAGYKLDTHWYGNVTRWSTCWGEYVKALVAGCEANGWTYLPRPSSYYGQKYKGSLPYIKKEVLALGTPYIAFEHGLHWRKKKGYLT